MRGPDRKPRRWAQDPNGGDCIPAGMGGRKKPDGKDPDGTKHVFGNAVGEDVDKLKTAWRGLCRRAGIVGLNFHDLRRERGSRWRFPKPFSICFSRPLGGLRKPQTRCTENDSEFQTVLGIWYWSARLNSGRGRRSPRLDSCRVAARAARRPRLRRSDQLTE